MDKLINTQYHKFVMQQIVRPYQLTAGLPDKRMTVLTFVKTEKPTYFCYHDLYDLFKDNRDWREHVICRLLRCYSHIDFSFFPDEPVANMIKSYLLDAGIKQYVQTQSIKIP